MPACHKGRLDQRDTEVVVGEEERKQVEGFLQVCLVVFSAQEERKKEFFIIRVVMWPLQPKMLLGHITSVLPVFFLKSCFTFQGHHKTAVFGLDHCKIPLSASSHFIFLLTLVFFGISNVQPKLKRAKLKL